MLCMWKLHSKISYQLLINQTFISVTVCTVFGTITRYENHHNNYIRVKVACFLTLNDDTLCILVQPRSDIYDLIWAGSIQNWANQDQNFDLGPDQNPLIIMIMINMINNDKRVGI